MTPGLSGLYRVGVGHSWSGGFESINDVVNALYSVGVSGECTFELTDDVYNASSEDYYVSGDAWRQLRRNLPAIDFRSKIPGVHELKKDDNGENI